MKDIKNFEGHYAVTSCGKVWSYKSKKFLKPRKDSGGYYQVSLWKDGKGKNYSLHRLVAQAYLPNPNNLPEVNHKNWDRADNNVNNLEWVTHKENMIYNQNKPTEKGRTITMRKVKCVETNEVFESLSAAAKWANITSVGNITECCKGKRKTAKGYHWEYVEDTNNDNKSNS